MHLTGFKLVVSNIKYNTQFKKFKMRMYFNLTKEEGAVGWSLDQDRHFYPLQKSEYYYKLNFVIN